MCVFELSVGTIKNTKHASKDKNNCQISFGGGPMGMRFGGVPCIRSKMPLTIALQSRLGNRGVLMGIEEGPDSIGQGNG